MRELLGQAQAHAVGSVGVNEAAVRHKADDPGVAQTVARPADGPQIGVVQRVLVDAGGSLRVGLSDPPVQAGVGLVGVVVIRRLLSHRVRRIAHDEADVQRPLRLGTVVVGHEDAAVQNVVVLTHLEGIRQNDPIEGHIGCAGLFSTASATSAADAVVGAPDLRLDTHRAVAIRHLDVGGRDVVGQQ